MTAKSKWRGHPIVFSDEWQYADTLESVAETWKERPCGHCGSPSTPDGHDGCLGTIPGVMNACCGHGDSADAYVQFENGSRFGGMAAVAFFKGKRNMSKQSRESSRILKCGSVQTAPDGPYTDDNYSTKNLR